MSQTVLGKQINGVWHTSVVVFGKEFYFGGGIQDADPGTTAYGVAVDRVSLGTTSKTLANFLKFLEVRRARFNNSTYNLLSNNCNHFSNECALYLTGASIPDEYLQLAQQVVDTPIGTAVTNFLQELHQQQQATPPSPAQAAAAPDYAGQAGDGDGGVRGGGMASLFSRLQQHGSRMAPVAAAAAAAAAAATRSSSGAWGGGEEAAGGSHGRTMHSV